MNDSNSSVEMIFVASPAEVASTVDIVYRYLGTPDGRALSDVAKAYLAGVCAGLGAVSDDREQVDSYHRGWGIAPVVHFVVDWAGDFDCTIRDALPEPAAILAVKDGR